jgi:hypothetical protein
LPCAVHSLPVLDQATCCSCLPLQPVTHMLTHQLNHPGPAAVAGSGYTALRIRAAACWTWLLPKHPRLGLFTGLAMGEGWVWPCGNSRTIHCSGTAPAQSCWPVPAACHDSQSKYAHCRYLAGNNGTGEHVPLPRGSPPEEVARAALGIQVGRWVPGCLRLGGPLWAMVVDEGSACLWSGLQCGPIILPSKHAARMHLKLVDCSFTTAVNLMCQNMWALLCLTGRCCL